MTSAQTSWSAVESLQTTHTLHIYMHKWKRQSAMQEKSTPCACSAPQARGSWIKTHQLLSLLWVLIARLLPAHPVHRAQCNTTPLCWDQGMAYGSCQAYRLRAPLPWKGSCSTELIAGGTCHGFSGLTMPSQSIYHGSSRGAHPVWAWRCCDILTCTLY